MATLYEIIDELRSRGWAFLARFERSWSTLRVAEFFGSIMDFSSISGYEKLPTVQRLRPRAVEDAKPTIYSGTYGMGEFPIHTDLAHWYRPPRYFILRCIRGNPDVGTLAFDGHDAVNTLGRDHFRRALFQPRRAHQGKRPLLRAASI